MTKAKTFIAKVISGGRVTIPEKIRELLNIKDGDIVSANMWREYKADEGE